MLTSLANHLNRRNSVPIMVILGIIVGIVASATLILFRLLIDLWMLNSTDTDFEKLPQLFHFLLPVAGGIIIATFSFLTPAHLSYVGIPYVIDRLSLYRARLSLGPMLSQFFLATTALLSGFSMGREGPAVHIGATLGSQLSQHVGLSPDQTRILLASGIAAAIALSFDTPIAGLFFAIEIFDLRYRPSKWLPVIAATVTGSFISQQIFGPQYLGNWSESLNQAPSLWAICLLGVATGALSGLFGMTVRLQLRWRRLANHWRWLAAGLLTGCIALAVPEVLGLGNDSLRIILEGQSTLTWLLVFLVAKFAAAAVGAGLGVPAGMVGPIMILGATIGAIIGTMFGVPVDTMALIGLTTMFSAVLQAPLAALLATVELSRNVDLVFPSMLCLIIANPLSRYVFKQPPLFNLLSDTTLIGYRSRAVRQQLLNKPAIDLARRDLLLCPMKVKPSELNKKLKDKRLLYTRLSSGKVYVLPEELFGPQLISHLATETNDQAEPIDLHNWLEEGQHVKRVGMNISAAEVVDILMGTSIYGVVLVDQLQTPVGVLARSSLNSYLTSLLNQKQRKALPNEEVAID